MPARFPGNLSARVNRDLAAILERSARQFGRARAARLRERIYETCNTIAKGLGFGHVRPDVPHDLKISFINIPPYPIVIAYDPDTNIVDRIIDARRDFLRIFAPRGGV
jgi:plasmid stabilization system protein ParE